MQEERRNKRERVCLRKIIVNSISSKSLYRLILFNQTNMMKVSSSKIKCEENAIITCSPLYYIFNSSMFAASKMKGKKRRDEKEDKKKKRTEKRERE